MTTNKTAPEVPIMYYGDGKPVSLQRAAEAVKAFAALWATGTFDCGPQDYKRIVEECLVERCLIFRLWAEMVRPVRRDNRPVTIRLGDRSKVLVLSLAFS
jgi:hypothetical protein